MKKNLPIILSENVFLCKGRRFSTVVDCNTGKLFRLDREATSLLQHFCEKREMTNVSEKEKLFIETLQKKNLISSEDMSTYLLPQMSFQIHTAWFELRKACNLRCVHCYNESNPTADCIEDVLSPEQWVDIAKQLSAYRVKTIILVGGEPLLYPGINDLMSRIREILPDASIVLYSNLTLLNPSNIEALKENKLAVVTSVYSDQETVHNSITQSKSSFSKTIGALKQLKQSGVPAKANTVIMRLNEAGIEETKHFIEALTGRKPKCDYIRCTSSDLEWLTPKQFPNRHMISSEKSFPRFTPESFCRAVAGNSCWQGKINITAQGFVSPCVMWSNDSSEAADLTKHNLSEIMATQMVPKYWSLSRDYLNVCKCCEYRYICPDCRPIARSLETRGLRCCYNPYTGKWYKDINQVKRYLDSKKINFQRGSIDVAFVLSCPGKEEEKMNMVCSGKTGENLQHLIGFLSTSFPSIFPSSNIKDYRITNASDIIHYKALTGDTEPKKSEIEIPENLSRLEEELKNCRYVVALGEKAKHALSLINIPCDIAEGNHVGTQSLNKMYISNKSTPQLRRIDRIEQLASNIHFRKRILSDLS